MTDQLDTLKAKLAASKRMGPGYADRIAEIEKQIAVLESRIGGDQEVESDDAR